MKKRMKSYYGWFPALILVTLFCCMPKTVSALRGIDPQAVPPGVELIPETPESVTPQEPEQPEEPQEPASEEVSDHAMDGIPLHIPAKTPETRPSTETDVPETIPEEEPGETPADTPAGSAPVAPPAEVSQDTLNDFFSDTLFIGDSRTVGLCEYSRLRTATFFSDVGMSVYQVLKSQVSVSGLGQVTLEELLRQKTFGKIHLMLGINELGYDFDTTVKTYGAIVDTIRSFQPDAVIYLGANLHVGKSRSDADTVINNPAIDRFNNAVADLADGETVFYVDVNPLFDDENSALRADLSGDGTHVYGSCYPQWVQWLYAVMQNVA